jgi:hypothetical protein
MSKMGFSQVRKDTSRNPYPGEVWSLEFELIGHVDSEGEGHYQQAN